MKGETDWLCWGDLDLGLSKGDIPPAFSFSYRNNLWSHAAVREEKAFALSWIAGCTVRESSKAVGNKYPITTTRENSFLFLSLSLRASLFNHGCGVSLSYYTRDSCGLTATLKGWRMKTGRPQTGTEHSVRKTCKRRNRKKDRKHTWNAAHSSGVFLHR